MHGRDLSVSKMEHSVKDLETFNLCLSHENVCLLREAFLFIHSRAAIQPLCTDLITASFLSCDYLREGVRSISSCSGEGSEESSSASSFNCVDDSLLRLVQVGSLSEGADEHKYIIHPWISEREQMSCLIKNCFKRTGKKCCFTLKLNIFYL